MENNYSAPEADLSVSSNTSGLGKGHPIPEGVTGWSWGAFVLSWIWALGNRTWIGLIALIPYIGFIMAIVLGVKGKQWAWQNKKWESVEHFQKVQRRWSIVGFIIFMVMILGILAAVMIPAYQGYVASK